MNMKTVSIMTLASIVFVLAPSLGFSDEVPYSIKVEQKGTERTYLEINASDSIHVIYQELESPERVSRNASGAVTLWKIGKDLTCSDNVTRSSSEQARHTCAMELWNNGGLVSNHDKISNYVPITKHLSIDTSSVPTELERTIEVERIADSLVIHLGNSGATKALYKQLTTQPQITADWYFKKGSSWSCSKSRKQGPSGDYVYVCNLWVRTVDGGPQDY